MQIYFLVQVELISTKAGGRTNPITTGYRGHWGLLNQDVGSMQLIFDMDNNQELQPGSAGLMLLNPYVLELWTHIRVGNVLHGYEGSKLIGTATVLARYHV